MKERERERERERGKIGEECVAKTKWRRRLKCSSWKRKITDQSEMGIVQLSG